LPALQTFCGAAVNRRYGPTAVKFASNGIAPFQCTVDKQQRDQNDREGCNVNNNDPTCMGQKTGRDQEAA